MVLPIIIGLGVTGLALVSRSGLRAWTVYKTLSPMAIAKLNGITIQSSSNVDEDQRFLSSLLGGEMKYRLNQYQGGFIQRMSEAEALLILNISPSDVSQLNNNMLKKKHRHAMIQNHPDKGGSPYLAMKINEAKDLISTSYMMRK